MNYSIHKAGLYMINIIKIFIQSSLLAKSQEDNLLYSIISQSATSPFMKKSKTKVQVDNANLNLNTLLIDISDGSKDNSSQHTPNFASPKSANNQAHFFDNPVSFLDGDYEVISTGTKNNKTGMVNSLY